MGDGSTPVGGGNEEYRPGGNRDVRLQGKIYFLFHYFCSYKRVKWESNECP